MDKKCFADKGRYCGALIEKKCDNCTFFQTKQQLESGRAMAKARLLKMYPKQYEKYCH